MCRVIHSLLLTMLLTVPLASVSASGPPNDDIRTLDAEVQQVKADVLDVIAELNTVEKRLLFPSGTRLTISFAMSAQSGVQPGAAEIRIDGNLAAHHVYSERELGALQKGGVQTLYTGNITRGNHDLTVRLIGKLANGADFEETGHHVFSKGPDAKTLDIVLDQAGRETSRIRIADR